MYKILENNMFVIIEYIKLIRYNNYRLLTFYNLKINKISCIYTRLQRQFFIIRRLKN